MASGLDSRGFGLGHKCFGFRHPQFAQGKQGFTVPGSWSLGLRAVRKYACIEQARRHRHSMTFSDSGVVGFRNTRRDIHAVEFSNLHSAK